MQISQFEYKDVLIDLTHHNGYLAWAFTYADKPYGAKVKVESKKTIDIASVASQLILNAVATYEDLRLPKGT